jgi:hypothetical protein
MPSLVRRLGRAVPLLLLAAIPLDASAQRAFSGWIFTSKTTPDAGSSANAMGMGAAPSSRITVAGGRMRLDLLEDGGGSNPMLGADGYMLMGTDGRVELVSPAEKRVNVMDVGAMGNMENMLKQFGGSVAVTDPVFKVEDLGDGEPILNYPTHKYRVTIARTTTIQMMGTTQSMRDSSVTEYWMTTRFAADSTLGTIQGSFADRLSAAGGFMAQLAKEQQAKMPKGFALRTHVQTSSDIRGSSGYSTEIVELRRATVDPALFKVPDDYQRIDMMKMMRPPGR